MIESIMFFGGGFLVASLLALVLISFVHHRAVRLTHRRLEDAIPVSMAEIQADKDNLRAEFAMSARRLEMSVEQLKAKATTQLGDIARKTEAINRLKSELAEKTGVTDELDARARSLAGKIRETEQEYEVKSTNLDATERALAAKEAELARAATDINDQRLATDTHRVEIAVLKTQVEQFKSQIEELQHDVQDAARRLFDERVAVSTVTKELEEQRQAVDLLRPQVAQLEREIAAQSNELENRARRIDDLEGRNGEQQRLLAQRDAEIRAMEQDLAANKDAHNAAASRLHAEKSALEVLLATANHTVEFHARHIDEIEARNVEQQRLLAQRDAEIRALEQDLAANKDAHNAAARRLHAEKSALEVLLGTANHTVESHARHIDEIEARNVEQQRLVARRDAEIGALQQEIAANKEEHNAIAEGLQAEKSVLESLLGAANNTVEWQAARINDFESWIAERDRLLSQRDAEAKALHAEIAAIKDEHNAETQRFQADMNSLERLLQTANHMLETRAGRIEDLEGWVAERDGLIRQRDADIEALFGEIAAIKDEAAAAAERLRAEKAHVEGQLHMTLEDRSQTQIELAALKHEAEASWRTERAENALLRERINDIAAQVAHMVMTMDKAGPIEAILAASASIRPEAYQRGPSPDADAEPVPEGNLTDRIRKLQNGASRASPTS
jgi:chromosome segregation ATPase